jgi:two-component system LytT family response regulator
MHPKTVLIIDDEDAARLIIRQYLEAYPELEIIGECRDGLESVAAINRLEPELVFLDIQMPCLSGFQVISKLVHIPQIVFTTAYDQYALKAFDTNAVDYLLKPYTRERFRRAVEKVIHHNSYSHAQIKAVAASAADTTTGFYDRIFLENGQKMISVAIDEIMYLQAEKDYTRVYAGDCFYLSNFGIGVLEQKLNPAIFFRIHRSFIVNIHHIRELYRAKSDTYLVMKNDLSLKVSRGYAENIRKLMC